MKSKIILISVLFLIFISGIYFASTDAIIEAELKISQFINPNAQSNIIFKFFTMLGEKEGVIVISAILLVFPLTTKKIGIPVAFTTLFSWIINTSVKHIILRERPIERLLEISGYSFPSGHAMNNMALYISIMLAVLPVCKQKWQKILLSVVCISVPIFIGISRIYFNVHYITDVICGWSLGAAIAIGCNMLFTKALNKRKA